MSSAVRPIFVTPDLERLAPSTSACFYLGLRVGDSELGLTADTAVAAGAPGRVLLSTEVPDVDALLPRVHELGGAAPRGSNDMP
ncbi:hypothetical protein [Blastococcus sp. SYSU DS0533]